VNKLPVRVGVDDIATETQLCEGWTYFFLPEVFVAEFTREAREILDNSKLHAFHGKKFKTGFTSEYHDFLQLIRKYYRKSLQTLGANELLSAGFKTKLQESGNRLLVGALREAGVQSEAAVKVLTPYIAPLFTLARVADGLGPNIEMRVEMDESEQLHDLSQHVHEVSGRPIPAQVLLKAMYNGHVKKQFPKAPQLPDAGVSVMEDTKSLLIQAADVIGNFSMAYVFVKLGKKSKSKEAKAALIEGVFADIIDRFDISGQVRLSGNDLELAEGKAAISFRMGWKLVKKPDPDRLRKATSRK